jgi:Cu/Ag efflux pump CusA
MLRWIVGSSLKFRFIIAAAAAALMFFGVQQLRHMPVDVFPEFAPPRVEIQTLALGLSGTEVESLVTVPLEQALNGVPELDVIRSKSVEQLSQIEMIFERDADLLTARQLVAERIAAVSPTLPRWAAPPVIIQPLSATSRVMKIGMTSDEYSLIDLSMTAYWKVRTKLLRVPGVANVLIWGERIKMPSVEVDPELLRKHDLTLEEVMTVTSDAIDSGLLRFSEGGFIGRGGFLDTPQQRLQVRHAIPILTSRQLAQVSIVKRGGEVIQLSDVADVVTTTPPLMGDGVIDDGPGLLMVVQKLPWANTTDVTAGLDAAIEDLRPALHGITLDPTIFRPATFIENAIDNLSEAMIIGALLMILMLAAFLYEWRTALISVTAIPLSLVGAGLVLAWMDVTINTMVLAGLVIALGDIVDDAIIDIENVVRRLREHRQEGGTKSTARVILEASLEVRSAIVYATLIEVVAVVPIFTL